MQMNLYMYTYCYKNIRVYVHTYLFVKMPRSGNIHMRW